MIVLCYRFLSGLRQPKAKNESARTFLIKKTGRAELNDEYGESAIRKIATSTNLTWASVNRILVAKKAK